MKTGSRQATFVLWAADMAPFEGIGQPGTNARWERTRAQQVISCPDSGRKLPLVDRLPEVLPASATANSGIWLRLLLQRMTVKNVPRGAGRKHRSQALSYE